MSNNKVSKKAPDATALAIFDAYQNMSTFLPYEDDEDHRLLFKAVYDEVAPTNKLETQWVIEISELTWNIRRLHWLKAALLLSSESVGVERVMRPLVGATDARALASDFGCNDPQARKEVEEVITAARLPLHAITAETYAARLLEIERIDRMIAEAQAQRSALFVEIERRRAAFAAKLRAATERVEDLDFREVDESKQKPDKDAA